MEKDHQPKPVGEKCDDCNVNSQGKDHCKKLNTPSPKPEVCPKDCQGHVTDGVAHTCPPSPASTEVKCDCKELTCKKDCTKKHTHKGFFCEKCEPEAVKKTYTSPASTERECENGHKMTGIGFDECPECEAPWKFVSTEDLGVLDKILEDCSDNVKNAVKKLLSSHDQQLRQRIVTGLEKMKKNTDQDSLYATPDNGYDLAIEEAIDLITNLK